jgi:arylsulfatase A
MMEEEFAPNKHGFDEFFGLKSGNVDMYSHKYRLGFDDLWENEELIRRDGYLTELLGQRSARFIDENANRPFFLYLAFNAVHWPFQAPGRPQDVRTVETWWDGTRANDYSPMTEAMDAAIGQVLAALDRHGLAGNTLVVFTNDNGGERLSDNRPLFHQKATLWEGGIRVPAIVRWPDGRIPGGRETGQVCATMDFTASFLSAAGAKPVRPLDGIDLLPVLRGERPVAERTLCWRINRDDRKQQAVRHGRWKYVKDGAIELLYDVERDPGERIELGHRNPAQLAAMRRLYAEWEAEISREKPPFVVQ